MTEYSVLGRDKVKVTLEKYLTKTGKWDLETMKLDLTAYKATREGRAAPMAM